jgi:predicted RNA-binding Zn ribbon-like protein
LILTDDQHFEGKPRGEPTNAATVGLLGGELCLDFVNTVEPRLGDRRSDYLANYADLVRWATHADALTEDEAERLLKETERQPDQAQAAHRRAVSLRETVYWIFEAIARGGGPEHTGLEALATVYAGAVAHSRIVAGADGFSWDWRDPDHLDRITWAVARSAAELLTSKDLKRVKECPHEEGGCGWLFYDASKNKSRRWCTMADCGSRAKMRRMYARRRAGGSGAEHEVGY